MITKIQEILNIPELKRKVLFTLWLLIVYRIGGHITTPGVDAAVLTGFFAGKQGTILGLYDLLHIDYFRRCARRRPTGSL